MTSRKKQTETMSLAEVVSSSGLSEATIRRHIKKGFLKAEKPKGEFSSYTINTRDYERWTIGRVGNNHYKVLPKKFMSLAEVVSSSGLSEATIRRHIKKGLLKAEKPGGLYGSYLVDVKSYQKWVKGQNT